MGVSITQEKVTPSIAKKWLKECNTINRPLTRSNVSSFVDTMRSGDWEDSGETIKFCEDGRLLDGQHRLSAIVETGQTITMHVSRGLKLSAYNVIDTGKPRSLSDMLARDGEKYASALASAVRYYWIFKSAKPATVLNYKLRIPTAYNLLRRTGGIRGLVQYVATSEMKKIYSVGIIAGAWMAATKVSTEYADCFFEPLCTGENLTAGEPAMMLRSRLVKDRASKERMSRKTAVLLIVKCWNAFSDGEVLDSLRITNADMESKMR